MRDDTCLSGLSKVARCPDCDTFILHLHEYAQGRCDRCEAEGVLRAGDDLPPRLLEGALIQFPTSKITTKGRVA